MQPSVRRKLVHLNASMNAKNSEETREWDVIPQQAKGLKALNKDKIILEMNTPPTTKLTWKMNKNKTKTLNGRMLIKVPC